MSYPIFKPPEYCMLLGIVVASIECSFLTNLNTFLSCSACAHLPVRNGLMNKVKFLRLIPQKW